MPSGTTSSPSSTGAGRQISSDRVRSQFIELSSRVGLSASASIGGSTRLQSPGDQDQQKHRPHAPLRYGWDGPLQAIGNAVLIAIGGVVLLRTLVVAVRNAVGVRVNVGDATTADTWRELVAVTWAPIAAEAISTVCIRISLAECAIALISEVAGGAIGGQGPSTGAVPTACPDMFAAD